MNSAAAGSKGLIIAIDGPSGAGKSSVTHALAERLGYVHIDTGAMFRVVALMVQRNGIDPADESAVAAVCQGLVIEFDPAGGSKRVFANGEDVSGLIRSPEISLLTSQVAALQQVRQALLTMQRQLGRQGGVVLEGRDIGTVVFPDADLKFFLTATPEERGRRRYEELRAKGVPVDLEQTVVEVMQRDQQDMMREHAPLRRAADAVEIDSTGLAPEEVLSLMLAEARGREGQ
jgi:cytidylate kinase